MEERIRPAIESGAAVGSSRPNLVVIDEIDGATGGGDNVGIAADLVASTCLQSSRVQVSSIN